MKTKLMLTSILVLLCSGVFSQEFVRIKHYPTQNTIKDEKGVATVANYKALNLSQYGYRIIEPVRLENALKEAAGKASSEIRFDCSNPEDTKPRLLGQLNQYDDRLFDVTNTRDLNLSLFLISGSLRKKDRLLQANFWVFKDFVCDAKPAIRAQVGMSLYVTVTDLQIKLDEFTLKNLTAAAQLGKVKLKCRVQFFGLNNIINFQDFNFQDGLNANNYQKLIDNWNQLKASFNKDTVVDPVIVTNITATLPKD